ncbi:MAG: hypothetical protein QW767_07105 [Thermoprotei archaeon]
MLFASILAFAFTAIAVYFLLDFVKVFFIGAGYYGLDVHKPDTPRVATMGGLISLAVVVAVAFASMTIINQAAREFIALFIVIFGYYGLLGLYDDLKGLRGRAKLGLTLLGGIVVYIIARLLGIYLYSARPYLPIIGEIHGVFFLYPFFIPVAFAVSSNAFNMFDVYNGTLSFASTVVFILLGVLVLLAGVAHYAVLDSFLAFVCAGASLGLFLINRYPSRFFLGDVGSLSLGSALAFIAITGRLEVVTAVAIMPMLMNGFISFGSVGKLFERHEIGERPVRVSNGMIFSNRRPGAPMSLANVLASKKPLSEKQMIHRFYILSLVGAALAAVTFFLTW